MRISQTDKNHTNDRLILLSKNQRKRTARTKPLMSSLRMMMHTTAFSHRREMENSRLDHESGPIDEHADFEDASLI